jgi:hypothetical protein
MAVIADVVNRNVSMMTASPEFREKFWALEGSKATSIRKGDLFAIGGLLRWCE